MVICLGSLTSVVYKIDFPVLILEFPAYFQFKFKPISVAAKLCIPIIRDKAIAKTTPLPLILHPLFLFMLYVYRPIKHNELVFSIQAPFLYSAFTDFLQHHTGYGKPQKNHSAKKNSIVGEGEEIMASNKA